MRLTKMSDIGGEFCEVVLPVRRGGVEYGSARSEYIFHSVPADSWPTEAVKVSAAADASSRLPW